MREALARADHDFVISETPRRKARAARPREAPAFLAPLRRRPLSVLGCVVFAGVLTGIVLNAAFLQNGRHPAPLFAPTHADAIAVPVPAPRPAEIAPPPAPAPRAAVIAPAAPAAQPQRAAEAPAPRRGAERDPIAALLRADAPVMEAPPAARVSAVQRALQKVGFVVRPDGHMNATTKQALAQFERDRNLPVTKDLSARTMRELATQSGVLIP